MMADDNWIATERERLSKALESNAALEHWQTVQPRKPRVWVDGKLLAQDEYDVQSVPIYIRFTRRERVLNAIRRLLRIPYQEISGWRPVLHFMTPPSGAIVTAYETEYGGLDSFINPPKDNTDG